MRLPSPSLQGLVGSLEADHRRDRAELRRLGELSRAVRATAILIHELQKERGRSSAFVAAEGGRFGAERLAQVTRTDEVLALAEEAWEAVDDRLAPETWYRDLAELRSGVGALAVTAAGTIDRYTAAVAGLLNRIAEAPGTSRHPQVTLSLLALFQFLLGKELTGQERALGAAVCAQGCFEPFQRQRFEKLGRDREEAWTTFARHAAEPELGAWTGLLAGPVAQAWSAARSDLTGEADELGARAPSVDLWYARTTAFIDALQGLEATLFDRLENLCEELAVDARTAWEDAQEEPDARDALVVRRLDRALTRLQAHRQSLRRGAGDEAGTAGDQEPLAADLAAGTAAAVDEALRWRRDLGRSEQTVRDLAQLTRQAQVLALDCQIQAVSRQDLARSALELHAALRRMTDDLGERIAILGASSHRTTEALETLHGAALALRLSLLEPHESDPRRLP